MSSADKLIPEPSALEDDVLRSMRRIIRAVDLYNRKLVTVTGVSGPQLMCLRELGASGPMPAGKLADAVNLSAATICGILDRLETRGLVRRERQTDDKRRVLVSLSDAGRTTLEDAPPDLHDSFLFRFRALSARQQSSIDRTLRQLVEMMAADSLDAAPILVPGHTVFAPAADDGTKKP